jgi:hypothetical protein
VKERRLLHCLQDLQCTIPRDKIFSLLAICDERDRIRVDYNSSGKALAHDVLKACPSAAYFCSLTLLARTLRLPTTGTSAVRGGRRTPILEVALRVRHIVWGGNCAGCSEYVTVPSEPQSTRLFCLRNCCSVQRDHLLWQNPGEGHTHPRTCESFLFIQSGHSSGTILLHGVDVRKRYGTDRSVVGVSLDLLLSSTLNSLV